MNSPNAPKRKMQTVNFHSVDEFLDYLPEDELKIVLALRQLVFDCIPGVTEKLVYNVPYYKVNRNICLIWPAAILWGNKKSYQGVRFGFTHGNLLHDDIGFLDKASRKQVYWKDFTNIHEIDFDLLKSYIFEAAEIDETLKKTRKQ